jgi:hypothetical protein
MMYCQGGKFLRVYYETPGPMSYDDKIKLLDFKDNALKWLKEQALKYDIKINFTEEIFGLDTDIIHPPGSGGGSSYHFILEKIGYDNQESFNDYVKNNTNCDNSLIILISSKPYTYHLIAKRYITGIAHAQHNAADKNFYLEGIDIYSTVDFKVIAHELLHCFGAWDLYVEENKTTGAELTRKRYPRSIMMSWNLFGPLEVDPITAWRIGWNKNPEPWFYECDPHKEK